MADNHIHNKLNPYMLAHCITRTRRFGRWRAHNIYVPMYVLVLIFILHLLFYGMRKDDMAITNSVWAKNGLKLKICFVRHAIIIIQ